MFDQVWQILRHVKSFLMSICSHSLSQIFSVSLLLEINKSFFWIFDSNVK